MVVSLFSYRRGNSILHRTPALVKLGILFVLCIVTFLEPVLWWKSALCALAAAILFALGGFWWPALRQMKFVLILGGLLTVFRMFQLDFTAAPYIRFVYDEMIAGIYWTIHFFITTWTAQTIFETTSSLEIQEAFEKTLGGKAALVLGLAITFIPLVFQTWTKVHLASQARSPRGKHSIAQTVRNLTMELEAFFSCVIQQAMTVQKAVSNRS